jgi:DNA-binding response OmpR family regulator
LGSKATQRQRAREALEDGQPPFRLVVGNTDIHIDEVIVHAVGDAIQESGRGPDVECVSCPTMEAIESHARRHSIDLFVIVLNSLTDCTVNTVLRRIRAFKVTHRKPILALAGFHPPSHSPSSFRAAALEAGVDAFLWFPFSLDELKHKVECLFTQNGEATEPTEATTVRRGQIDYPTEGFELRWDAEALHIQVTDYEAGTLSITWDDILSLARIARGGRCPS